MEMAVASRSIVDRMKGAAMLDVQTYEEVEADTNATGQAALVVAIVAVCSAIGNIGHGGRGMIGGIVAAIVGWLVWAGITYLIGTWVMSGKATWGELLRTLGFAQTPGILLAFAFVPLLGWLVRFVIGIWMLVAGIIAIRQALDVSTGSAIGTAVLGWIALLALSYVFGSWM